MTVDNRFSRIIKITVGVTLSLTLVTISFFQAYSGTIRVDQTDGACVTGSGQPDPYSVVYCTIQDAIDDAAPGDTVSVWAGIYEEQLVIDTGITLTGLGTGTIVRPTAAPVAGVYDVEINASDTTIHNLLFEFNGLTGPVTGERSGNGMVISDLNGPDVTGVTISNNLIFTGEEKTALQTGANADVSGLLITGNTFYGDLDTFGEGIYVHPLKSTATSEVTISDNSFVGVFSHGMTIESNDVVVTGNSVNSNYGTGTSGIRFVDLAGGETYSGVQIGGLDPSDANTIQNFIYGIHAGTASDSGSTLSATIQGNTITGDDYGLWGQYGADLTVTGNTFELNSFQVFDEHGALDLPAIFAANTFDYSAFASSGDTIFNEIQDAIDEASAADTVSVGPGIYAQDLVIPEALTGLELVGSGSGSTTIKGVANVAAASWPLAAPNIEVLADNVSIHEFTIQGPNPAAGFYSSGVVVGGAGLEVYNNAFQVPDAADLDDVSQALQTYSGSINPTAGGEVDGLNVHDNTFNEFGVGTWGYEGIYINTDAGDPTPGGTVTITGNTFTGDILRAVTTERSNVVITNNSIASLLGPSDLSTEGAYQGVNVPAAQDITLTGNAINGFWKQVDNSGGALNLADAAANNLYDHSAYASSGTAIFWYIQDAIDEATAADTVAVGLGTYDEQVVIDTQIALAGNGTDVAGGTATILQPTTAPNAGEYDVEVNASGTLIQDIVFDFNGGGASLVDGSRSGNGIVISDLNGPEVSAVEINATIIYTGHANTGIQTGKYADVSGLLVQNNTIYADVDGMGEGVYINPLESGSVGGIQVLDNVIVGNIFAGVSVEASDVSIRGNQVHSDVEKGIYGVRFIDLVGGETYSGVEIGGPSASDGNLIDTFQCGVKVGTTTDVGSSLTANIQWNDLRNNDAAICLGFGANTTIAQNIFTNNGLIIRQPYMIYLPLISR